MDHPRKHRPFGLTMIVGYKALWGLGEVALGLGVFFLPSIVQTEIGEDPQDAIANWLLAHTAAAHVVATHAAVLLLVLGAAKILLAIGMWRRSWVVRDVALVFFSVSAIVTFVNLVKDFTVFNLGILVVDILISLYVWRIFPHYLPERRRAS